MTTHEVKHHKFIKQLLKAKKFEELDHALQDLSAVEIANSLLQLDLKHQLTLLNSLSLERASDVLSNLEDHPSILQELVEQLNTKQLSELIEEMEGDDAADFVAALDENKAEAVLASLPSKDRQEITTLLQYNAESAGGIMNPYVVAIQKDQPVKQAIDGIRNYIEEQDEFQQFYTAYVVDEYQHLIGTISVTHLLLADAKTMIKELMDPNVVAVDVDLDQEEVVRVAQEYDLVVVPVIDKHLRLIGRITIDDLVDVIYEEYQEDIAHIVGTGNEEVLETSIIRTARDRLPWLLLGLGGGFLTAIVMSNFEGALSKLPQVTYFIPLVAAIGGNIGIQSSSIVVRGLATGEIHQSDLLSRLWKELRVALLGGMVCSGLLLGMAWYLTGALKMGILTGFSLLIIVCIAASVGATVPIFLKRMNIDPALAIGPFITTANDMLGVMVYLSITFYFWDFP